jgi:hypothetical protein
MNLNRRDAVSTLASSPEENRYFCVHPLTVNTRGAARTALCGALVCDKT